MATRDPHPIVHWELTRLCDQHCRGCPSGGNELRDPNELSTYEAYKTIDQIAAVRPRELIISGGDPLRRNDVAQIIEYTRRRGLDPALVLVPTDELTRNALVALERCGLTRVVFSIEVNTLVVHRNLGNLRAIAELIRPFDVVRWNVHFPVPIGASRELEMITADEVERVFAILDDLRVHEPFALRVVEAPHYRRYRIQRMLDARLVDGFVEESEIHEVLESARDALYISHAGDVRPSELAPQSAGNLRYRQLGMIDRGSDLLVALLFGADPLCAWEPVAKEASA